MRLFCIAIVLLLTACTNPESATRALEGAGYSNVQIGGYDWFNCSKDDTYHTKFTAKGPTGRPVSGVVCEGMVFKSSTIRLD